MFIKLLKDLAPALTRLSIGFVFAQSGWGKLHNLEGVVGFFTDLGLPAPSLMGPFVAGTELVAGGLVIVGLFTRLSALPLIGTMAVAYGPGRYSLDACLPWRKR